MNEDLKEALELIIRALHILDERTESIMSTLQDLVTEDAALGDEINQVIALLQQDTALISQLQGAIGSGNLTPEQQANVDNLFAQLTAQHDQVVAALTPAPPAPAEPTPAPPADVPPVDPNAPAPDPVNG